MKIKAPKFPMVLLLLIALQFPAIAQKPYDSVSIARFVDENMFNNPTATYTLAEAIKRLQDEKFIGSKSKDAQSIVGLLNEIKSNGTADIAKCFYPRHAINFYRNGRVDEILLICFECDGLRFVKANNGTKVKKFSTRIRQMNTLKKFFARKGYTL